MHGTFGTFGTFGIFATSDGREMEEGGRSGNRSKFAFRRGRYRENDGSVASFRRTPTKICMGFLPLGVCRAHRPN
jgi:hypothetical protein